MKLEEGMEEDVNVQGKVDDGYGCAAGAGKVAASRLNIYISYVTLCKFHSVC